MQAKKFTVVKKFVGGILDGIEYPEQTDVEFVVGWKCEKPIGGSPYVIVAVTENAA